MTACATSRLVAHHQPRIFANGCVRVICASIFISSIYTLSRCATNRLVAHSVHTHLSALLCPFKIYFYPFKIYQILPVE